ncbi:MULTISPECIES: amidohydrolase family protein [unclassified Allomuricauda]|uniref:amidohydrolase family protein n=1 Tax=unclassified Allomuricauda TaxID=2615049 RepID=UPI00273D4020|nr:MULTISPECIES: amidohydrolase family protein [unclassified Allomuricauda]
MKLKLLALLFFMGSVSLLAQDYFPINDGVKAKKNNNYMAFTNAKIYVTPTQVIDKGTLLIQNGKVVQVGKSVNIPKNAVVEDLSGKSIYPSFIDIYSGFGVKLPEEARGGGRSAQYEPSREGFYWNDHIMPENDAINNFSYDAKAAKELRNAGFGAINAHIEDGIARGTGLLVALNDEASEAQRILSDRSAQYFSFEKSRASRQSYPSSLMGAMALMRQVYYDMDWYSKGNVDTKDRSLEALIANQGLTQIYAAGDNGNVLRADKIGDLFGIQYTILAGGDEYERIDDIKATNAKLILPLNFPDAFDVSNPYEAKYIALKDMRHWNLAPSNPKVLADNGVEFSITLHGLKSPKDLKEKIMKAITYGLSKTKALEALTTVPAQILGKSNEIGTLQAGSQANFLITSGDLFDKGTTLYENWVQGTKNIIESMDVIDIRGDYDLAVNGTTYKVSLTGDASKPKAEIKKGDTTVDSKIDYSADWLNISFSEDNVGSYRMVAQVMPNTKTIKGNVVLPNGDETSATLTQTAGFEEKAKDEKQAEKPELIALTYPNVGYGYKTKPKQEDMLFKNATVWTGESILENTDVLIKKGKIAKIGKDLRAGGATVVDATGKHLTAGIIDEHTHIAALSINEGGQNSSAEVHMEDVVDPKDMDIYRNLAGGVTTAQLLHGSANPIGGQSAILRFKWGENAEGLIFENSPKFIKFALGENVKQSNWGSYSRFPQTRMGVEQVYTDYFQRAKEYDELKKSGQPYRYDEEMETLAEILNGERFISCHSYVQSEINMMMKVAEKFGFRVNTFTHILEGYKVADKMAEHGVGGGTFSDWWAYKYEVNDAIPYNAAIMTSQGVTVAINSDDAEMSRRLNQEAAKTVKYGGMSEIEAWKTVTLNPAKLLHLDDRVGSIEEGKDADVVLWTDHPLSIYAKAEKTLVEGAVYFDLEKDKMMRESVKKERNKLIGMMLNENKKGGDSRTPVQSKKERFECDTL